VAFLVQQGMSGREEVIEPDNYWAIGAVESEWL